MSPRLTALDRRVDALLSGAQEYFMGVGAIHDAAEAIGRALGELGIDYAIAGAIALGEHGFQRLTTDVDVLIARDDLARFKDRWLGRGYEDVRAGGKAVRDTANNVRIDFLIAGDFPGDGLPKPVAFPDPARASVRGAKYRVLTLSSLIELKLASGMTAPHRLHDLADVLRLIRHAALPRDFALQLDPYVRVKFEELWRHAQHPDEDY
jgi:hypothetical protein